MYQREFGKEENEISGCIIHSSIVIHKELGPGLFESVYEEILYRELIGFGFNVERQRIIPITYGDILINGAFKADLIVENKVIVEIKSIEAVLPVHKMQLKTYLKLTGLKLGLLLNFNVVLLKNGITRIVNQL